MTQEERIIKYLEAGNRLTPIDALNYFRCMRLAPRIHELRNKGYRIKSEMVSKNGKHYAEYWIPKPQGELF